MENKEYGHVIGSSSAPYINGLAHRNVLLTNYYAISHPSLPNYLALTGGSTFGIQSDCINCNVNARNIVDQLRSRNMSWRAYMQSMPHACFLGATAGSALQQYAKRHDPFLYYNDVRNNSARCHRVVPLTRLPGDLRKGLPRFAWITPNVCNDMHDCPVSTGDRFLRSWVPRIMKHLGSNGIVIVVFDEGSTNASCCGLRSGGGHVVAIVAGPGAKNHIRIGAAANHYSLLRLIEDALGLRRIAHAGDSSTPSIRGWRA